MYETGEVTEVSGENVILRVKRTTACGHCRACTLGSPPDEMVVTVRNVCGAKVHDRVRVDLRPGAFVNAALILYGIPLAGMLVGFAAGDFLCAYSGVEHYRSLIGFACGVLMVIVIYCVIKRLEPFWRTKLHTPAATAVLEEEN